MKLLISVGLPLLYALAVFWGLRPPPPKYAAQDATAVTVKDEGGPAVLHAPDAIYPEAALRAGIEGNVILRVTVDEEGRVSGVDLISGAKELAGAAIMAVRQWQFAAKAMETEVHIPFMRWHPGPRSLTVPEPLQRIPAVAPKGLHGMVRLVAMVDPAGRVEFVQPVSGTVRLRQLAVKNVKQWIFRPALRDGKPDRGTAVVEVVF